MSQNYITPGQLHSPKDKQLPPVPSPLSKIQSSSTSTTDSELLQAKTLRRKNFKKLSLTASPPKPTSGNKDWNDDVAILREVPTSLRERRHRPAPILNLQHPPPSLGSPLLLSSYSDNKPSPSAGIVISQTINRQTPSNSNFNVNASNRNIDPDQENSTDVIINQISNLELNNLQGNKPQQLQQPTTITRKRQTVISSISPTKSNSSSPTQNKATQGFEPNYSTSLATTSAFTLNNEDLLTLKTLGSGNSGTVSKILHIPTQKTMAKKIIHIDLKSVIQRQIIRELRILHECHSPYIIDFYGAFLNSNNTIVICMEYCNCGSLDKILSLSPNKQFPLFVLKKLAFSILSGLTYLYTTHKILHRDIKPNNVLMTHKGEFKLCDFGVSRELTNSLAMADTFVGTSTYMSPERIQGLNYGVKSDVWSMGLMLIELASGIPVWTDDDDENEDNDEKGENRFKGPEGILDLLQRIVNEKAPSLTGKINPVTKAPYDRQLCEFIDSCLIKDDTARKSPWQLLEDKQGFLKGVEEGIYDKEHKNWAKNIRKLMKEKYEQDK